MQRHFRSVLYVLQLTVSFCLLQNMVSAQSSCPGFKTFTQGGWGSTPNGNNPGTILNNGFSTAFPNGLTIGCTNKIQLTSAAAVRAFLPNGTTPSTLPAGTLINPTKTNFSNVFAGQLVALTLNIGFDNAIPSFGSSNTNLKDLVIASGPFMGKTVQQLFVDANAKIGGCTASNISLSEFTSAIDKINNNYDNGVIKGSFLVCPLKVSCTSTDVSCFGGNNGSMSVSLTGGRAPYTYTWSGNAAGNVSSSSSLTAGTYTVTVNDAVGQSVSTTCIVGQPTALTASDDHANVKCNGGTDGIVGISFSGGTAPYTVSFNGGEATAQTSPATYNNLSAGSYSWTVTDANGCTQSGSEEVGQPTELVASDDHADVKCNGGSDGSMTISFSGGTAPYVVSLNGADATIRTSPVVFSGLSAATYSWVVMDANGCTKSGSEIIGEPTLLIASDDHADVKCNGGSDGSVSVSFGGGTAPYTVSFNGGEATAQTSPATYNNLSAGSYSWTVTDANGCTQSGSGTVGEPTVLVASGNHNDVKCHGGNDGSVSLSFSGGTSPYTVSFNGGEATAQTSPAAYGTLSAGTYSWVVTDANGCTQSGSETIGEPTEITATENHSNVLCNGANNGSATISFEGGTGPYSVSFVNNNQTTVSAPEEGDVFVGYGNANPRGVDMPLFYEVEEVFNNSIFDVVVYNNPSTNLNIPTAPALVTQSSPAEFRSLAAGSYTWTIVDANGCTKTGTVEITQPEALVVSSTHNDVTCANGSNGVVKINYAGGVSPYSINFNGEISTPSSSPAKFLNLSAGVYVWSLTDSNGCMQGGVDTVTQPIPVEVSLSSVADNNCNDNVCNGSSTAIVTSGGNAPYSYTWTINGVVSVSQTAETATALCPNSRISVRISDANGCIGTSALDTIRCINGPAAHPDSTSTPINTPINGTLKNNDNLNPDCTINTWSLVSNPRNGTVTVQSNGDFTYTPNTNFTGLDTFYYKICDCNSMCDTSYAIVSIAGTSQCVPLKTYSQGGWGATNNPAKVYMYANFATAFPNGITLGCGNRLVKFTTPQSITNWLPAGTNNYLIPVGTLTNPNNSNYNSNLTGQLLAATLSVGFDAADTSFATGTNVLGSMYYQRAPFIGMTVNQIIQEANKVIGGCASSFTVSQLGTALAAINLNYDGVGVDNGNLGCKVTSSRISVSAPITTNMFPNPASTTTNLIVDGNVGETAIISLYDISGRLLKTQKVVMNAAKTTVSLVVSDIQNQTCIVRITKGGQTTTTKLVVKH